MENTHNGETTNIDHSSVNIGSAWKKIYNSFILYYELD